MRLKQTKLKVNTTNLVDCLQQAGGRPNPEAQKNRKPDERIFDQRTE